MKDKLDCLFRLTVVFGPPIAYFIITIIVLFVTDINIVYDIANNISVFNFHNIIGYVYIFFLTILTIHSFIKVSEIVHKI